MKILDLTSGNRAIWVNKQHPLAVYLDRRKKVAPDFVIDTRKKIPKHIGYGFDLVVFDPPHMNCGKNSNMSRVYGHHTTGYIRDYIRKTAIQVHKITKKNALMALKWNTHDIKLSYVFLLMPQWEPLFGHITKDGPGSKITTTLWE